MDHIEKATLETSVFIFLGLADTKPDHVSNRQQTLKKNHLDSIFVSHFKKVV